MGPERGMHKVEFSFFILLVALFRLAQFLTSPLQQYQATTIFCQNVHTPAYNIIDRTLPFTHRIDAFMEWFIAYSILSAANILHWVFWEGLVAVWCVVLFWMQWTRLWYRYFQLSWQWWLLFISGLWNAPDARLLRLIWIDPGWRYQKQRHRHLQPKRHRQFYRDHQYHLHQIHAHQVKFVGLLRKQLFNPFHLTVMLHFGAIFCCGASIIKLLGLLLWYTMRILAFKCGLIRPPDRLATPMKKPFKQYKPRQRQRRHYHATTLAHRLAAFSTVLNIDDMTAQRSTFSFDSDATSVICDNSANVHVCNDRNMFVGDIQPLQSHAVATIGGNTNVASGIGNVKWRWKDDTGHEHSYLIHNVLFFPESPINILSITEFANQLNDDSGTGITTYRRESVFFWDNRKFSRTIVHPASNLPEMAINDGFALHSFWTKLIGRRVSTSKYHCHCSSLEHQQDLELNSSSINSNETANEIARS